MAGARKQASSAGTDCSGSPHVFFWMPGCRRQMPGQITGGIESRAATADETLRRLSQRFVGIVCLADLLAQRLTGGALDDWAAAVLQ